MFKVGDRVLFTGYRDADGTMIDGEMLDFLSPVPGDIVELLRAGPASDRFPFRVAGLVRGEEGGILPDEIMVRLSELEPIKLDTPLEDFL